MTSNAILISKPSVNFDSFLAAANLATGRNLAEKADRNRAVGDDEKFVSCLATLAEPNAPIGLHHELLNHVTYSAFIVCLIYDVLQILSVASGMVFSVGEARGNHAAMVLTGTLEQWRTAIENGTSRRQPDGTRELYCRLMERFESAGLG
jgi:hypothetical protein